MFCILCVCAVQCIGFGVVVGSCGKQIKKQKKNIFLFGDLDSIFCFLNLFLFAYVFVCCLTAHFA